MTDRSWSWNEIEAAFLNAMESACVGTDEPIMLIGDGKKHRYRVTGDKKGSKNGWYILYLDGIPAGAFGSYKSLDCETWCIAKGLKLTPEERAENKRRMDAAKRQHADDLKAARKEAAEKCRELWNQARPADSNHAYLTAKGVKNYGLRQLNETLQTPVRNASGHLVNLQFITPDGEKRFKTSGEVTGCYYAMGKPEDTLCIAEGYATAATIFESTGLAVAVAFNAGNLMAVAKAIRKKLPQIKIILCADHDQWTVFKRDGKDIPNPGLTMAREAAQAVSARLAFPDFTAEQIERFEQLHAKKPTDFNDLMRLDGLEAVKASIVESADNVVDISVARDRRELEKRIDDMGDEPEQGEALAREVRESDLSEAGKNRLLGKIAKSTGLRMKDLQPQKAPPRRRADDAPVFLGEDPVEFVPELNSRHAVVPFGGKVFIMTFNHDPQLNRRLVQYYLPTDMDLLYANRTSWRNGDLVPISKTWLTHPDRQDYDGVIFSPGMEVDRYYNLWQGWGVEAADDGYHAAAKTTQFFEFLFVQICARNDGKYQYLCNWLAHLFQRPSELPEVAIVMRSGRGTGKNTFVDTIASLVGNKHFIPLSSLESVTGQFSGHLADALLVHANEAIFGGNKSSQGMLNAMITDSPISVRPMFKEYISLPNYKRFIFSSNENWVVPVGMDERRYAIFDVSHEHKQDHAYFNGLRLEMAEEGFLPALMRVLMDRDISDWHPRTLPDDIKNEGIDMKLESASTIIQWWYSCLDYGLIQRGHADNKDDAYYYKWLDTLTKQETHAAYVRWCAMMGKKYPAIDKVFGKQLKEFGVIDGGRGGEGRIPKYEFPSLDELRRKFAKEMNVSYEKMWTEAE